MKVLQIGTIFESFSLTSSQAHHAFKQAIQLNQDDEAWIKVAKYLHGASNWRSDLNLPLDESNEEGSIDNAADGTSASNEGTNDATDAGAGASASDENSAGAAANSFSSTPRGRYMQAIMTAFCGHDGLHPRDVNSDQETEETEKWDALFFIAYFVNPDILEYDEWTAHKEGLFENIQIDRCFDLDDGHVLADEEECNILLRRRGAVEKNLIFDIVRKFIPEEYRIARTTKKSQVAWLLAPNSVRQFHFYNSKGLKAEMVKKGIAFAPGSGRRTIDDMIKALSGDDTVTGVLQAADIAAAATAAAATAATAAAATTTGRSRIAAAELNAMPSRDAAIVAMLNRSFLPHQKGVKREHCSLGHKLEKPILKKFIQMTKKEGRTSPVPFVNIKGAYTAGLAAKKGAVYAKDSIDFVLLVENDISSYSFSDTDSDSDFDSDSSHGGATSNLKAWGFEVKGRVTARTAADEENHIDDIYSPHQRIKADTVHQHVANVAERFQVMQHAYVYDLDTVVLAIGDSQSDLIRSSIIDFPKDLRASFGKVLSDIKDLTLFWLYDENSINNGIVAIPDEIVKLAEMVPGINGAETLQGTANLYVALDKMEKPIPSFHRLIPGMCAFWNSVKGGSDTSHHHAQGCFKCKNSDTTCEY